MIRHSGFFKLQESGLSKHRESTELDNWVFQGSIRGSNHSRIQRTRLGSTTRHGFCSAGVGSAFSRGRPTSSLQPYQSRMSHISTSNPVENKKCLCPTVLNKDYRAHANRMWWAGCWTKRSSLSSLSSHLHAHVQDQGWLILCVNLVRLQDSTIWCHSRCFWEGIFRCN